MMINTEEVCSKMESRGRILKNLKQRSQWIQQGAYFTVLLILVFFHSLNAENQQLVSLHIALKSDTSLAANSKLHQLEFTDNGELYLVVEYRPPGFFSTIYLTEADSIIMDSGRVPRYKTYRWDKFLSESPQIRWYLIEPANRDSVYTNFVYPHQYAKIEYVERELQEFRDKWVIPPPLDKCGGIAYRGRMTGTVFVKAEILYDLDFLATPGAESRFRLIDGRDFGGLGEEVFHVSRKGGFRNKILSNFMIFSNLPEISNPVSYTTDFRDIQTLHFIGGNFRCNLLAAAFLAGIHNISQEDALIPEGNQYRMTDYYFRELNLNGKYYSWKEGEEVVLRDDLFGVGDLIWGNGIWGIFWKDSSPSGYPDKILGDTDQALVYLDGEYQVRKLSEVFGDTIKLIRWKYRF